MAYVYTHKTLDTDVIFYVGIGSDEDNYYQRRKSNIPDINN